MPESELAQEDIVPTQQPKPGYFEKYGVKPGDVAKSLLYLKLMNYSTGLCTLVLCYKYRPLKRLSRRPGPKRMISYVKNRWPSSYKRYSDWIDKSAFRVAQWRPVIWLSDYLKFNPRQFALAFAENLVIYKGTLPIVLPLQFLLIVRLMSKESTKISDFSDLDNFYDDSIGAYEKSQRF